MASRNLRRSISLTAKSAQLAVATPEVVAHRLTRMARGGAIRIKISKSLPAWGPKSRWHSLLRGTQWRCKNCDINIASCFLGFR
jgi:hypothetical protein